VADEISTLKQGTLIRSEDNRLGIEHASFQWNAVEEDKKTASSPIPERLPKSTGSSIVESEPVPGDSISVNNQESEDHKFELRDINIVFPDRQLTVVTGPSKLRYNQNSVG
jgi:hypothetical protein